jgi:hypothetical protein
MPLRLKVLLIVSCFWTAISCAADNYGVHPAAQALVDELVVEESFDRDKLLLVFAEARRWTALSWSMVCRRKLSLP